MNVKLDFYQVAYVVSDLDSAVRHWADVLGVGPWSVWTMESPRFAPHPLETEPKDFGFRHALAWCGETQIELIEHLHGTSIFAQQLDSTGPGASHLGAKPENPEQVIEELLESGYTFIQGGSHFGESRDGSFTYLRTPQEFGGGQIIEIIAPPSERFAPDYVYPESGE